MRPDPDHTLEELEFFARYGWDLPVAARALRMKPASVARFLTERNRADILARLRRDAA